MQGSNVIPASLAVSPFAIQFTFSQSSLSFPLHSKEQRTPAIHLHLLMSCIGRPIPCLNRNCPFASKGYLESTFYREGKTQKGGLRRRLHIWHDFGMDAIDTGRKPRFSHYKICQSSNPPFRKVLFRMSRRWIPGWEGIFLCEKSKS
jgi:hypothetical protein